MFNATNTLTSVPAISTTCHDNGSGRCDAEGHECCRYQIDSKGWCTVGRRLLAQTIQCPSCQQFFHKTGEFILNHRVLEKLKASLASQILEIVGDKPVCQTCAGSYNACHTGLFWRLSERREAVEKFVRTFLDGAVVKHRHESLGHYMRNWCDACGRLVPFEEEDEMGGIIRGNSVICICPDCCLIAREFYPELEDISFFNAMERIGVPVRRQTIKVAVPSPAPRFASIKAIYEAIMNSEKVRSSGRAPHGGTECTVHANTAALCKCRGGIDDWKQMKAVVHGGRAFGFGQACEAALKDEGIILPDKTLQEAIVVDIGSGTLRPSVERPVVQAKRRGFDLSRPVVRERMSFINPHAERGGKKKGKRHETARDQIVARARVVYEAALAVLDRRIAAAQGEFNKIEAEIDKQKAEIAAAQDESDQELHGLLVACANERIAELLPTLAGKQTALASLKREREEMVRRGTKPFRDVSVKAHKPASKSDKPDEAKSNSGGRKSKRGGKKK